MKYTDLFNHSAFVHADDVSLDDDGVEIFGVSEGFVAIVDDPANGEKLINNIIKDDCGNIAVFYDDQDLWHCNDDNVEMPIRVYKEI